MSDAIRRGQLPETFTNFATISNIKSEPSAVNKRSSTEEMFCLPSKFIYAVCFGRFLAAEANCNEVSLSTLKKPTDGLADSVVYFATDGGEGDTFDCSDFNLSSEIIRIVTFFVKICSGACDD